MTDTGTQFPHEPGLAGDLREAAAVPLSDAPSAVQVRRRGDRRRKTSRVAVVSAALALLGGTATAGVYAGQSAFAPEGDVTPPAATAGPSPSASPSAEEATPGVEFRVEVDAARSRLTVYSNDLPVRTLPVTAGDGLHPTPEGRYTVTEKSPVRQRPAPTRDGKATYDWYIALDNPEVFLAQPYWNALVGGEWVYDSGENVTNGWIALPPADAEWLYGKLDVGDTVIVGASGER